MSAGRPSKYDPAFCEQVIATGAEGGTLAEMADAIDIDRSTLNAWVEKHPEFSRAVKRGLEKAQAWWERNGRLATFGGKEGFNATSWIFNMKNRFSEDWKDKRETELSGGLEHRRKAEEFSDDELAEAIGK
jgi:transposase-like protein